MRIILSFYYSNNHNVNTIYKEFLEYPVESVVFAAFRDSKRYRKFQIPEHPINLPSVMNCQVLASCNDE